MLGDLQRQSVNPAFRIGDGINVVLQHDLLRRVIKPHRRQPASISLGPVPNAGIDPPVSQETPRCWRALDNTFIAVARARTKSRIASWAASGTQTPVSSPARCSLANITASRRPNLSRTTSIGHRNGNRRLVHIQPNEADRMHLARLPCMRLCADSPAQPSFLACRETGRFSALREHTV